MTEHALLALGLLFHYYWFDCFGFFACVYICLDMLGTGLIVLVFFACVYICLDMLGTGLIILVFLPVFTLAWTCLVLV